MLCSPARSRVPVPCVFVLEPNFSSRFASGSTAGNFIQISSIARVRLGQAKRQFLSAVIRWRYYDLSTDQGDGAKSGYIAATPHGPHLPDKFVDSDILGGSNNTEK
jgi:hypothetical protein